MSQEWGGSWGEGWDRGHSRLGHQGLQTAASHACFCRDTNVRFSAELRRLQSLPKCERLPLPSFLLLPFQRITRLRMLLQVPVPAAAVSAPPTPSENSPEGFLALQLSPCTTPP